MHDDTQDLLISSRTRQRSEQFRPTLPSPAQFGSTTETQPYREEKNQEGEAKSEFIENGSRRGKGDNLRPVVRWNKNKAKVGREIGAGGKMEKITKHFSLRPWVRKKKKKKKKRSRDGWSGGILFQVRRLAFDQIWPVSLVSFAQPNLGQWKKREEDYPNNNPIGG